VGGGVQAEWKPGRSGTWMQPRARAHQRHEPFDFTVHDVPRLAEMYEKCMPYYQALYEKTHPAMSLPSPLMNSDVVSELQALLKHYDLGSLQIMRRTSAVLSMSPMPSKPTRGAGIFCANTNEHQRREIQFEHSLINHLVAEKAPPAARLYPTHEGKNLSAQIRRGAGYRRGLLCHLRLPAWRRSLYLGGSDLHG